MEIYMNKEYSPKERAKDLISKMSIEEKLAQTYSIFPWENCDVEDMGERTNKMSKYGVGSVSCLYIREIKTLKECIEYQRRIQAQIIERSPHNIPATFHMEGLCGGFIQGCLSLPSGINRGAAWNPELEEKMGQIVSKQEKALGITQILAPVLDVSRDSRMGRQGETYGEDPTLASALGVAFTKGIQEDERADGLKAESVAKHFMGFHNSLGGIHGAESLTPPRLLREVYGKPFQAAISEAELRGVMPCYCTFDGEAASSSKRLLTDILRDEMKFDGIAVSDYNAISNEYNVQGLYESLSEAGLKSMSAGMDMEWPQQDAFSDELIEWFKSGKADISILDTAVERILEAKFRMGLFENPYALDFDDVEKIYADENDVKIIEQLTEQSIVLLKNEGVLPLSKNIKKIALIGPHGANPRSMFGGYTHISMAEAVHAVANSIAGIGDANKDDKKYVSYIKGTKIQSDETEEFEEILKLIKPNCLSLKDALVNVGYEIIYAHGYPIAGADDSEFEEALKAIKEADVAILTLGGKHGSCSVAAMGEGVDGTDINLPKCQDDFIVKAAELGKPLIGIHFNGRPISSDIADEKLNGIIEAFNPSEFGAMALTNILTGKVNPSGKLPLSVAYNAGQIPIYYNHPNGSSYHQGESIGFKDYVDLPHTPRYFFGYGLSYTEFEYSNLCLSSKEVGVDETLTISCDIKNIGKLEGTEIVQMYLKDIRASLVRPCMELQGFARVSLKPGQVKRVSFEIQPSIMAFLNHDMEWMVEKGEIEVLIGASSNDIRLNDRYKVIDTTIIDGSKRMFYAKTSIE